MTDTIHLPADETARQRIRSGLDATLDVVAGAGTGKTRELVERVVSLLADVPMSEIGVITFTNAAASELQERIHEQVETLATKESGGGRYTTALRALDDAAISTLHAFAQRILTDHPLEASLPPGFEVLDAVQESVAFEDWWQQTLDDLFDDPSLESSLLTLGALGVRTDRYKSVAAALHQHHDRTTAYRIEPQPVPAADLGRVLDAIGAAAARRDTCTDPDDKLVAHLDTLLALDQELRALADDELELLTRLDGVGKLVRNLGRKDSWPEDGKAVTLASCEDAEAARLAVLDAVIQPALHNVLGALVDAVNRAADTRRRDGRVTFHDLLVIARDLLRDHQEVRTALAERYQFLLLDEFQDTDPLQIDLALRIAGISVQAEAAERWSDITPRPGALFVVGDPKQSIYRFRRADIELYNEVIATLTDEVLALTVSFRSRPGIIEWVNAAMGSLFEDDGSGLQVPYSPLDAYHPADPTQPCPVARIGGPVPKAECLLGDLRHREAVELAALARRIHDEGWRVRADAGERHAIPLGSSNPEDWVRPATFADIAVLVPTRTLLPDLEAAFAAAEVPLRIESQSLLFATTEAQDLVAILGAIDDPADAIRLVAALRTAAFGCSDADLLDYHEAEGSWSLFASAPEGLPADHVVVAGLAALRRLHDEHQWESPAQTVERVVRERALFALALVNRRPRDHWRRLRFLTDAAHAFTDAGGASLRGFVHWLDEQREEGARVNESVSPEPDDDAVRVLTVHGSKGLEFPVVLLAGLGVGNRPNPTALYHGDDRPELRFTRPNPAPDFVSPGYSARVERENQADRHEGRRLLYVATARARDHLIVSLHHHEGTDCYAKQLVDADTDAALPWRVETIELDAPIPEPVPHAVSDLAFTGPVTGPELDAWWSGRQVAIARSAELPVIAATGIARALRAEPEPELVLDLGFDDGRDDGAEDAEPDASDVEPEGDRPAWRRGRGATALGRAVHAVLQTADLATGDGIEGAARAQALAEGIPEREVSIIAMARSVLESPVIRTAATTRSWREVPVAAEIGSMTVEGFIDLLIEDGDDLIVVDYKTDSARSEAEIDAAVERYRPQGAAYALALEHVLGRRVTRCVFVFARASGPSLEREVHDLDALVDTVRDHLRGAPTSGTSPSPS